MTPNSITTREERFFYCLQKRQELEVVLKDWELIGGLMQRYKETADRILEDIRIVESVDE